MHPNTSIRKSPAKQTAQASLRLPTPLEGQALPAACGAVVGVVSGLTPGAIRVPSMALHTKSSRAFPAWCTEEARGPHPAEGPAAAQVPANRDSGPITPLLTPVCRPLPALTSWVSWFPGGWPAAELSLPSVQVTGMVFHQAPGRGTVCCLHTRVKVSLESEHAWFCIQKDKTGAKGPVALLRTHLPLGHRGRRVCVVLLHTQITGTGQVST